MKVVIYARNITSLDGVGNSIKYFNSILSCKFETLLVAIHSDIENVCNINDYLDIHEETNVLIYHFSIYDLSQETILNLNFQRKIIYYHGITNPSLFRESFETSNECRKGLEQIKKLDIFDLYFANSSYSKNQFLAYSSCRESSISFNIMPPINIIDEDFGPIKKISLCNSENLNYYYLGTLGEHKNVKELCELFLENEDKCKLNIITSFSKIDTISYFKKDTYYKYLANDICFYHRLSDNKKNKIINDKNCFITFSSHEGFCIPIFEAIYLYKPVLAHKLTCLSDYFPSDYFYLDTNKTYSELSENYILNYINISKNRAYILDKYQKYLKDSWHSIFSLIDN